MMHGRTCGSDAPLAHRGTCPGVVAQTTAGPASVASRWCASGRKGCVRSHSRATAGMGESAAVEGPWVAPGAPRLASAGLMFPFEQMLVDHDAAGSETAGCSSETVTQHPRFGLAAGALASGGDEGPVIRQPSAMWPANSDA